MPGVPAYAQYAQPQGPIGQIRPTGLTILLFFVTLGIWGFVYYYQIHEEMKRHTGEGLGGVLALVVAIIFAASSSPYLLSHEVGRLYERRGQAKPVSAITGLWFFPGIFILVGPFIWFVQTNDALNEYWESLGARRPQCPSRPDDPEQLGVLPRGVALADDQRAAGPGSDRAHVQPRRAAEAHRPGDVSPVTRSIARTPSAAGSSAHT